MIYVLYGQPGSVKAAISRSLAKHFDTPFIINERSQCCWPVEKALQLLDARNNLGFLGDAEKQTIKNSREAIRRARDEFRGMFKNNNHSVEGREENIRNANAVATFANEVLDGRPPPVIMDLVNPYKYLRDELRENNKDRVVEVLLKSNRGLRKEHHVEDFEAGNPDYTVDTDRGAENGWNQLKDLLKI